MSNDNDKVSLLGIVEFEGAGGCSTGLHLVCDKSGSNETCRVGAAIHAHAYLLPIISQTCRWH